MPKYKVTIIKTAEIEVPNVVKAKQIISEIVKLPSMCVGGKCYKHDSYTYVIKFKDLWISNPTKVNDSDLLSSNE